MSPPSAISRSCVSFTGTAPGQLRRGLAAFLKEHPLVAKFELAPTNQGGGGVTVVELKD